MGIRPGVHWDARQRSAEQMQARQHSAEPASYAHWQAVCAWLVSYSALCVLLSTTSSLLNTCVVMKLCRTWLRNLRSKGCAALVDTGLNMSCLCCATKCALVYKLVRCSFLHCSVLRYLCCLSLHVLRALHSLELNLPGYYLFVYFLCLPG